MFMIIKCRPRLVQGSAMCRQSEVLSQISRPSEGRPSGVLWGINGILTFGIK